ncbi:MAG: hypothetical protein ACRDTJ_25175, partial [Pseudonocardiaceae bacterium]
TLVAGDPLPPVLGLDDAADAGWVRADSWEQLASEVPVFSAHTELIREVLCSLETAVSVGGSNYPRY